MENCEIVKLWNWGKLENRRNCNRKSRRKFAIKCQSKRATPERNVQLNKNQSGLRYQPAMPAMPCDSQRWSRRSCVDRIFPVPPLPSLIFPSSTSRGGRDSASAFGNIDGGATAAAAARANAKLVYATDFYGADQEERAPTKRRAFAKCQTQSDGARDFTNVSGCAMQWEKMGIWRIFILIYLNIFVGSLFITNKIYIFVYLCSKREPPLAL